MSPPIDPYHRFLGIPPYLQPPNHYRLLGLELFESHPDVIDAAADRQMTHVRKYEGGPYAAHAQKLLNELAKARVDLLLPERKAVYDATLRKQLASSAAVPAPSQPPLQRSGGSRPPQVEEEELILAADPPRKASSSPASPKSNSGLALHRTSPSASGSRKPAPPPAAPRTIAVPPVSKPYSPIDPLTYEPPYMGEYRRRFFATLLKVIIFVFILIVLLILFNAFVLPWLREGNSAPEPSFEEGAASSSMAKDRFPSPPPPPISSNEKQAAAAELPPMLEIPADNPRELDPDENRPSIFNTIRTALQNDKIRRTRCIGEDAGEAFEAKHGDGGLLVALKLTWKKFGKNGEYREVASLQPEYLTSLGCVKGSVYGTPQQNGLRFLAKQGYAVGALKINFAPGSRNKNGRITGLRIIFMRIDGLRLNPKDSYASSSFPSDSSVPLDAPEIGGNGDLAVGLHGSVSGEELHSLGLLLVKQAVPPNRPADTKQTPPPSGVKSAAETPKPSEGKNFFVGSWQIYENERYNSTVTLSGSDKARDSRYHDKGGRWEYKQDRVRILWKDGWADIMERDGDKVRKYSFAPSDPEEQFPVNEGTAVKSRNTIEE